MPKRSIYLIPFLVGLALAAALAAGVFIEQKHFNQKSRLQVLDRLTAIQNGLESGLYSRLNLLEALRTFVRLDPDLDGEAFAVLADGLFSGTSGIRSVELARDNVVSHVHPGQMAKRVMGRDLFTGFPASVKSLAGKALKTGKMQIATPKRLPEGGEAILAATPIFLGRDGNGRYWGMALMRIDSPTLFREAGLTDNPAGLVMALRRMVSGPDQFGLLFGDESVFRQDPVALTLPAPDGALQLAAAPAEGWPDSPNRPYVLYGGIAAILAITGLLFSTVFLLMGRVRERDSYRHLIQNARSIILRMDRAGTITFCNEYAGEFYGYGPGELIGKPMIGTLVPLKSLAGESLRHHLNQLIRNPAALPFNESMNVRKNGEAVWVAWSHKPVMDDAGQVAEILSVGTDITDRKFMEEALRQRERQYRLLAQNVTDVIFGLDADLHYTFVSPSDQTVRGYPRTEVLGLPVTDFLTPASGDRLTSGVAGLNDHGNRQQSPSLNLEFLCADGSTVWLETRLGLLVNDEGDVIGYQGVGRDITDRKLAEALRDDVERMARHDLKTPLGAVIGLPGEIRLLGGLTQTQENMLATIEKAGESMLQRINHSLDLHKMERGTYVLKRRTVDVLGILEEIKAEIGPLIREKAISLGIEVLGEKRDDCPALADEDLFRSMLSNLVLNALQASPEGGTVTVTLKRGANLTVTIRNQGEVPLPLREIFFEKYATTDHGVGTGLGTYSARLIARTHGGDIEADTTEPGHTSVRLTLPQ